jgi:subtilisin family serine protease
MHYIYQGHRRDLEQLPLEQVTVPKGKAVHFAVEAGKFSTYMSAMVTQASRAVFGMVDAAARMAKKSKTKVQPKPMAFRDTRTGRLRVVYREILVQFRPGTSAALRDKALAGFDFKVRHTKPFKKNLYVIKHKAGTVFGEELIETANDLWEVDEVEYAEPHFVSEFRRYAPPKVHPEQWHLENKARVNGQRKGADVNARKAWKITQGSGRVTVAIVDDGVDVKHPNLEKRIKRKPDADEPRDKYGRDFFLEEDVAGHFDPNPKIWKDPFQELDGNDSHGTPCAGVVAADGSVDDVRGVAPKCRILPVKIFHADAIAVDSRVADAIRYATLFAEILSCSWGGPPSGAIADAIKDAGEGRGGRGVPVFCAAGNDGASSVDHPARQGEAIAVAASTDRDGHASYSNTGPEISVCAPSNGGKVGVYTTDVSLPDRGFNPSLKAAGGADGLHTNDFGGTSSATPLAAGVAALCLSANSKLTGAEVREILEQTAEKIGSGYDDGHSRKFGYGRVDAQAAVAEAARRKAPRTRKRATRRRRKK